MKPAIRTILAATAAAGVCLVAVPAVTAAQAGAAPRAVDPAVKAGVDAWQAGDPAAAVRHWRPLAERGDADAQFNIGQAYRLGKGAPLDLKQAQAWFQKAAVQGHAQAQANYGIALFQSGSRVAAMPWLKKGADAGDARSQYVLGTALFNGDIAGKDWPRAYALMNLAAAQGMPPAAANLEQMDKLIPLAERQRGLALAKQIEAGAPALAAAAPARAQTALPTGATLAAAARPAPAAVQPRPVAVAARAAAAPAGGWRVQLGAFGNAANARRYWEGLRGKAGALGGLQPAFVPAGAVTRLQAGPLTSRAAADKVCAAAKAAGSACFPIAP
jgi:cell division septation protein DedD